jgi:hypothetical protein
MKTAVLGVMTQCSSEETRRFEEKYVSIFTVEKKVKQKTS